MFGRILILFTLGLTSTFCSDEDITLGARRNPPHHSSEEELKDLVVVSMQSIVSLNQLVTELTSRLVKVTLTVEDTAQQVKQLRASLTEETTNCNNQIKDVAGQLDELKRDSNVTIAALSDKLQGVVEQVGTEFGTVEEEFTTLRDEVTRKNSAVSIVSAEAGLREASCSKVCAGSTGRSTSAWKYFNANGITIAVDMTACGFVAVPTVTTAMEGRSVHWETTGSSEVYHATATSFSIYIYHASGRSTTTNAASWNWNIEWVAVGYIC